MTRDRRDGTRILLVEDNPGDARLIEELINEDRSGRFDVVVAETLSMAERRLASERWDAILADLGLPDSQGMDTVESLLRHAPGEPLIVLTGLDDREFARRAIQRGAQDYLAKTQLTAELLVRTVRYAIERQQGQLALARSEERFRRLTENAPDIIYRLGLVPSPGIEYVSRSIEAVVGYTPEEMSQRANRALDVVHPEDRLLVERWLQESVATASPTTLRLIHADGHTVWVEDSHTAVFDARGERVAIEGVARDVTQRVRAEERFRLAAHVASDLVYEWDTRTDELTWFRDVDASLGYASGTIGVDIRTWLSLIHPDDRPRLAASLERHRESFEAIHEEYRVRHADGSWRHWLDQAAPIEGSDGRPRRWVGVCVDVTEQKLAAEALRSSELRFRTLFELAPIGILTVNLKGKVTQCNDAFVHIAGHPREAMVGHHFSRLPPVRVRDIPRYAKLFAQVATGDAPGPFVATWKTIDGESRTGEIRVGLLREEGGVSGAQIMVEDITSRHAAERQLRESEAMLRSILQASPVGIGYLRDGRFEWVSDRICGMLGRERTDLIGQSPRRISASESDFRDVERAMEENLVTTGTGHAETRWIRSDGRILDIDLRFARVDLAAPERGGIFTALDVTDRKQLEAQLRQNQRLESIGTLASGVAHEINNPLMGMINYAELIGSRAESEELARFADGIKNEGARIAKIVRNLLSFSRQVPETHSSARLVDIVESSLSLVGSMLRKDRIELECDVSETLPAMVCRSQQIQQVIINLLLNARDGLNARYADADPGKVLCLEGRTLEDDQGAWIRLTIEDCGIGMSPEVMARIFDPFFTTKGRDQGTGLGLSISYGIVRDHDGRLTVESEEGAYARFHVDLPLECRGAA